MSLQMMKKYLVKCSFRLLLVLCLRLSLTAVSLYLSLSPKAYKNADSRVKEE